MSEYNSVLIKNNFEEFIQLKKKVEKDFEDEHAFHSVLKFLQYNLPYGVVRTLLEEEIFEKDVKEFDPVEGQMGKPFKLYDKLLNPYIDNLDGKVVDEGLSFIFYGPNQAGKSMTAQHILASAIEKGLTGYYETFKSLLNIYNKGSFKNEGEEKFIYDHILNCDVLVIDEVGKESSVTDNVIGVLEEVVKRRSEWGRPTIIATNIDVPHTEKGMLARYGNSVWSAFMKRFRFLYFAPHGRFREKTRATWDFE